MDSVANQPTNQTNQDKVWQLVIARPMSELQDVKEYLKTKCIRVLGREHEADEEIKRTHCHFSLVNFSCTTQALSKFLNSKNIKGSDNFGCLTKRPEDKGAYDDDALCVYIVKGQQYDETKIFLSGHEISDYETYRTNWVNYKEINKPRESNKTKTLIQYKLKYENPKEAKIRKSQFVKLIIERLKAHQTDYKIVMSNDTIIFQTIRELIIEYNEVLSDYKVLDYYDAVKCREAPGRWIDGMLGLLEKRKPRQ